MFAAARDAALASPIHGFSEQGRAEKAQEASTSPAPAIILEEQMPGIAVPDQGQQGQASEGVLPVRACGPGRGRHTRGRVNGGGSDPANGAADEVPPSSLPRLPHLHAPLCTYRYILGVWFPHMPPHCTGSWRPVWEPDVDADLETETDPLSQAPDNAGHGNTLKSSLCYGTEEEAGEGDATVSPPARWV